MIYILYKAHGLCESKIARTIGSVINSITECRFCEYNISAQHARDGDIIIVVGYFAFELPIGPSIHIIHVNLDSYSMVKHQDSIFNQFKECPNIVHLTDYQGLNIRLFEKICPSPKFKIHYLPMAVNDNHVMQYQRFGEEPVNKDIDVLFYGWVNDRRGSLLQSLAQNHVVRYFDTLPDEELIPLIKRSRIVINIYYYDHNRVFDYYRLAFLLSNQVFFVTEKPDQVDFEIEPQLLNYQDWISAVPYADLASEIRCQLAKSQDERNRLAMRASEWFQRQFNYKQLWLNLINEIKEETPV